MVQALGKSGFGLEIIFVLTILLFSEKLGENEIYFRVLPKHTEKNIDTSGSKLLVRINHETYNI